MFKVAFGIAAAAALAMASPAAAAVLIDVGPGVLQPDENVLFNNGPTPGPAIEGVTNQSGTVVVLEAGESLSAFGGQARVRSPDLALSSLFNFRGFANQLVGFDLAEAGLAFTETEFRVFGGTATELTLTFVDTAGEVFQQTLAIPKSGFFNAQAIDGQLINYFSIAANGTLGDIRQFRIGGITAGIPEPATWAMMLLGFGTAGAMLRTRRRLALA
jgi:hypothetical protein